jgi:hypothetical protein
MDNVVVMDKIISFDAFLEKNSKKICENTPINPAVSKTDEWLEETEWEELYNELKEN